MSAFFTPAYQPFAVAALVLLGLVLLEVATLVAGSALSGLVESVAGTDGPDVPESGGLIHGLDWLNVGRVPLLILLMIALALFATAGIVVQTVASAVAAPLPVWLASAAALIVSFPLTRLASRGVARVIPRDETYAVGDDHFVGRVGVVTVGPVQTGSVARIKIRDQWGNWHFPRARPSKPGDEFPVGAHVLVVDRVGRELAVTAADDILIEGREQG